MNGDLRRRFQGHVAVAIVAGALSAGCTGDPAVNYLEAGIGKLEAGDDEGAVRLLEKAAEIDSGNPSTQCNLGVAYWNLGEMQPAIERFRKAADMAPGSSTPFEFMGRIHLEAKNWDEARNAFEQANERFPFSPRIITSKALVEFMAGEFGLAIKYLGKALELDPNYPPAVYNLAYIYKDNPGHRNLAEKYFKRYLQVSSELPEDWSPAIVSQQRVRVAREFLGLESGSEESVPPPGVTEVTSGREEKITEAPAPVLSPPAAPAADPSARELVVAARAAVAGESYDEALVLLSRAIKKDPGSPDALWEMAELYDKRLKYPEQAASILARFRKLFPDDPRGQIRRLPVSLQPAAPVVRTRDTRKAIEIWGKGLERYNQGDWNGAISYYTESLEYDDTLVNAWYNLGLAYKAKKDLPAAGHAFARSVKLSPKMIKANYMLAVVCWERKENAQAIEYLNRSLAIDANYAHAYYLLGLIYRDGKNVALARMNFERYLQLAPDGSTARKVKIWLENTPGE